MAFGWKENVPERTSKLTALFTRPSQANPICCGRASDERRPRPLPGIKDSAEVTARDEYGIPVRPSVRGVRRPD